MRIVFFGTPDYVLPIVERLHKAFETRRGESPIAAVVTQKPKPAGRKQLLLYSPVDTWAHKKDIKILRYLDIKQFPKADIGILAAYGEIIPTEVINHFPGGILNIHPSLLPKYRGASPVPGAIVSGEKETGVTIIKLDEKWDHGPIVSQFKEGILPTDTTGTLRARLFERSADVLVELTEPYLAGKIKPRPQDDSLAIITTRITKDDGFIPPKYLAATLQGVSLKGTWKIQFIKNYYLLINPYSLERFIRAMDPWPHAWSCVKILGVKDTKILRLIILKAHVEADTSHHLVLDEVQLEGKNPVSWKQFRQAYPNAIF